MFPQGTQTFIGNMVAFPWEHGPFVQGKNGEHNHFCGITVVFSWLKILQDKNGNG
jgi:hypothetical protein